MLASTYIQKLYDLNAGHLTPLLAPDLDAIIEVALLSEVTNLTNVELRQQLMLFAEEIISRSKHES